MGVKAPHGVIDGYEVQSTTSSQPGTSRGHTCLCFRNLDTASEVAGQVFACSSLILQVVPNRGNLKPIT